MPGSSTRTPDQVRSQRAYLWHDVLSKSPAYRKLMREAVREYDAWLVREKTRPKTRGGRRGISIPKSTRRAA